MNSRTVPSSKASLNANTQVLVAIVGQPNVGKSSLFNRLAGRRLAIVSEESGTTRDRISAEVIHDGRKFLLVDTAGLINHPQDSLETQVMAQVDAAVSEADLVLLVTDVKQGITPGDLEAASHIRRSGRPVVLACNKVDRPAQESLIMELNELGLGEPLPISAYHKHGLDSLLDAILDRIPVPANVVKPSLEKPLFAIIGRPNVGKSTLANALLGHDRSIVSEIPGTTRDTVDSLFSYNNHEAILIDTAGIRRRGSVIPGIERYSVLRAIRAIDRCDVAILVLDGTNMVTAQDRHIAGLVMESFKGMVIAINKWDLVATPDQEESDQEESEVQEQIQSSLRFIGHTPINFISAAHRQGLNTLLRTAFQVRAQRMQWLAPEKLQEVVMGAIAVHLPPKHGSRSMKIYRVKQENTNPPTFVFYCNNPSLMHFSYERYLENTIRQHFGFQGTHLRLEFRGKGKIHIIGEHRTASRRARK